MPAYKFSIKMKASDYAPLDVGEEIRLDAWAPCADAALTYDLPGFVTMTFTRTAESGIMAVSKAMHDIDETVNMTRFMTHVTPLDLEVVSISNIYEVPEVEKTTPVIVTYKPSFMERLVSILTPFKPAK